MAERLQKLMARAGLGSRRECEKIIQAGRVRVNGRIIKLGDKADPAQDRIEVNGRLLKLRGAQDKRIYIALNKPKGVISSLQDELKQGRRTVRDLISLPGHLYPVGRLDKQSTGLMLMTNDGDLAHKLTHPRYGHEKIYRVNVSGKLDEDALDHWRRGVRLDGRKTAPVKIKVLKRGPGFTLLEIIMREGRKRQIRRVGNQLGYPIASLVREKIGPISLGNLKPGEWRLLSPKELSALQKAVKSSGIQSRRRPRKSNRKKHR